MTYRYYDSTTPITRADWNARRRYVEGIYPALRRHKNDRLFAYWACRRGIATVDTATMMAEVAAGHEIVD